MLENLSDSLNSAGFDIDHIADLHELSSALDTLGIDVSGLGDHQMDLLLDALHHNGMTVTDLAGTAQDVSAVDPSAGGHDHNIPAAIKGLRDAIIGTVTTGVAAGLKDTAAKAVKDTYDGLNTLVKGRYQKHQNVRKI